MSVLPARPSRLYGTRPGRRTLARGGREFRPYDREQSRIARPGNDPPAGLRPRRRGCSDGRPPRRRTIARAHPARGRPRFLVRRPPPSGREAQAADACSRGGGGVWRTLARGGREFWPYDREQSRIARPGNDPPAGLRPRRCGCSDGRPPRRRTIARAHPRDL